MPEIVAGVYLLAGLRHILLGHVGRADPITAERLATIFGYCDDRPVRRAIERLIDDDFPVCSVTDPPAGYFFPADVEEAREYTVVLRRRALKIFQRRRHIVRSTARWYERARQLEMV